MKLSKNYKPEMVTEKPSNLFKGMMHNAYMTGEHLIATNGHALVKIPVEKQEGDTPGLVSPAALKAARKIGGKYGDAEISANGKLALSDGQTFPRPSEDDCGAFPKMEGVNAIIEGVLTNNKFTIGIDASILFDLAEALGSHKVKLTFETAKRSILVQPFEDNSTKNKAVGVLMPYNLNGY